MLNAKEQQYFFKVKRKIDAKINHYSYCLNCSLEKFATIHKELSDLLKTFKYV